MAPRYRIVGSKVFDAKTGDELSGLNIKAIQAADVTWRSLGAGIQDAYEYAMYQIDSHGKKTFQGALATFGRSHPRSISYI